MNPRALFRAALAWISGHRLAAALVLLAIALRAALPFALVHLAIAVLYVLFVVPFLA